MRITVKEYVELVSEALDMPKSKVQESLNLFAKGMQIILEEVKNEDEEVTFTVPNLGSFKLKTRNARQGRNPKNPEEVIDIPETKALTFKQSSSIKELINK